jgi:tetratricopeptide (TPR) repeat protein
VTAHANDALRIDADNVRAHVLLGRMHMSFNRYAEAEQEIQRAIDVNPNDAEALAGQGNVLLWRGRVKQALTALEMAQRLDPELNTYDRFALALAYYLDGQYARAIDQGELNVRKTPEASFNLAVLAAAYARSDKLEEARRQAAELRRRDPTFNALLFGNKFQDLKDLEHLRKGLEQAGIYSDR